jgi:Zinc carboxypeptidase
MDCKIDFINITIKMRKIILYIQMFFGAFLWGQMNPQSKEITQKFFPDIDTLSQSTPALKKEKGFTNYEELTGFLENLVAKYPNRISLSYIGESQKGYKIPMVILKSKEVKNPIKVYMQGGLHGDEPASIEGMLYLTHALLSHKKLDYLFDKIELAIVPMANIDGSLKLERNAANGLDLNRDQTKLMAVESVILKNALNNFNPEVALDFHEFRPFRKDFTKLGSFGVTSIHDVMFLYSGNLNVPQNMRNFTQEVFIKNAKEKLNNHQITHHDYFTTNTYDGAVQFDLGSLSARSSATSFALQNRISTLIEIRGVGLNKTSFKRRTFIAFCIGLSYLETTFNECENIKETIKIANENKEDIVVKSKKTISEESLKFIDLDSNNPIDIDVTLRNSLKSIATLSRKRPIGYVLDSSLNVLVEKLKILGFEVKTLEKETNYKIESYQISSYKMDEMKTEKMNLQEVNTVTNVSEKVFPKGSFYVSLNQKGASLIAEVLEPEMPNSFISFGVLKTEINQILPIYRHIQ